MWVCISACMHPGVCVCMYVRFNLCVCVCVCRYVFMRVDKSVGVQLSTQASAAGTSYHPNNRARTVVPLSLVCTSRFVPLPVCDHSQGVYFPPNRRWSTVFRVLFQQTKKHHIRVQTGAVSELIRAVATACLCVEQNIIGCPIKQFGFPTVDKKIPENSKFGAQKQKKN